MTFTEAAVEVLRRAGKPLHFKEIATEAVNGGMLSHVGQTPEETMGLRLLAMSRREHQRTVVALDEGVYALAEWGVPTPPPAAEPPAPIAPPAEEPLYRTRERHPPLQREMVVGSRRDERRRGRGDEEGGGRRRHKYPPPAIVAWEWLRARGEPATLAEIAHGLREGDRIAEALERDLESFERALREENRRRQDGRRALLFEFGDAGAVKALEAPPAPPRERPERQARPRREEVVRPQALDEQLRAATRMVRRRLGSLDVASFERVITALLEAQGYRELNMARRSAREGSLYLARRKWGASELRYAIRILRPGRDLVRTDVQDVRRDLGRFSGQMGVLFGTGECAREAKSEGNTPNQAPVILYGGEAVSESLIEAGLGATKRLVEWFEYDEEFFASMGAGEALPDVEGVAPAPSEPRPERDDRGRRPRDRRRDRRPRDGSDRPPPPAGPDPAATTAPEPGAPEAAGVAGQSAAAAPPPADGSRQPAPEPSREPRTEGSADSRSTAEAAGPPTSDGPEGG